MSAAKVFTACGDCGAPTPIGRYGNRVRTNQALTYHGWRLSSGQMVCLDCQAKPGFDPSWKFECSECKAVIRTGVEHAMAAAKTARRAGWMVKFAGGGPIAFCPEHQRTRSRVPRGARREVLPDYLGVTCARCGQKRPDLRSSQAKALGWGSVFNLRACPKCLPSAQREVA